MPGMTYAFYFFKIARPIEKIWQKYNISHPLRYNSEKYPCFGGKILKPGIPFLPLVSKFSFQGCSIGEFVDFVPWREGFISTYHTFEDKIAVSYCFSGCYMAKYTYRGRCFISHIQSGSGDCRQVWNNFYNRNRDSIVVHAIFRPTDCHDSIYKYKETQMSNGVECTIAGVILPNNKCYAVLVNIRTHMPIYIREISSDIRTILPLNSRHRLTTNICEEDVGCCRC